MPRSSHARRDIDLDRLRATFPGYEFERDPRPDPPRYAAIARELGTRPRCVISDDLAEIERELVAAQG